ncbi:MAG: serine--tRNA ligase [Dehalococcoidia bacterium]|jgi:seryl-tRNA synthetase|nr:serine--tRNA ligase [Dehalococcoidia bacterium]MDP6227937.1 serine--tRNA ligase [Dehalococcoidia bacterium]MDP7084290.1 serine--tRNA ligase [Dehalococcoidia bacterium]MDP7201342.1 serine--tRNA ligase [Dehalococcoidia bacterium]MDP7511446.1 serine--tRNA ligase [Dehalococcoidia bacterium]
MLSIDLIRKDPDLVRRALESRGEDDPLAELLELDAQRRRGIAEGDELRGQRNRVSRSLGQARASGQEPGPEIVQEMRRVGESISQLEQSVRGLEERLNTILMGMPNLPLPNVPPGLSEENNVVVRSWGEPGTHDFTPLPHWELGENLGLIDFQRGVKLSGSRFYTMFGAGAKLERALISWMLDLHTREHGYTEAMLPLLVKRETMEGSGNLPKFGENLYHDDEDDLWLIPTAEVPITNLYRDEVLPPGSLPRNYVAHTPCFRREKAAAGRDTRGIKRVHQFNKVEMYKFVTPETSEDELEKLVADAEDVCRRLELPYRVLQLCKGDLGFPSAMTYDIEAWAAGCQEWLEVSSCSNCTDFQARRARIRYRPEPKARPELVHTLNGSGLALPRVVIAILENYQQADGSVVIPDILRPYTGFDRIPVKPGA